MRSSRCKSWVGWITINRTFILFGLGVIIRNVVTSFFGPTVKMSPTHLPTIFQCFRIMTIFIAPKKIYIKNVAHLLTCLFFFQCNG